MILFLLSLAACGNQNTESNNSTSDSSEGSSEGKPKVAVVIRALNAEYYKLMEAGAKQAFEDLGVEGEVLAPTNDTDFIGQNNMLEDLLSEGVDALVVMPTQSEAAIPVLQKYKEKNIPVLLVDSDVDWEGKTTFIGTDNVTAGEEAGKLLASMLSTGAEVAIIEGVSGTPTSEQRVSGAEKGLNDAGMKIVASQAADSSRDKAVSVMENILTANPDVKGVFAINDEMALGALRAINSKNLDIPVIGLDGITEAVESIQQSGMEATVAQKPYDMTYTGVESALKAINGETVEKRVDSGFDVITKENSEEQMKKLKEYLEK
ncbi:sugar ABC transporter substrate-binding protein [Bacillus sp. SD075]|nr:sugar ABC transporter substrate-binding protein [Bacillus sp. SD075]